MNRVIKAWLVIGLLSIIFSIYSNENIYDKSNFRLDNNKSNTGKEKSSKNIQKPPFIWVDLLIGIVRPGSTKAIKFNIDFFKGITGTFEWIDSGTLFFLFDNWNGWSQLNVLIGKRFTHRYIRKRVNYKYYYSYFLVGFGKINGVKNGEKISEGFLGPSYEIINFNSFCVPIEFGIVRAGKCIGVGINIHINLNKEYPVAGVLINIPIGYIIKK